MQAKQIGQRIEELEVRWDLVAAGASAVCALVALFLTLRERRRAATRLGRAQRTAGACPPDGPGPTVGVHPAFTRVGPLLHLSCLPCGA